MAGSGDFRQADAEGENAGFEGNPGGSVLKRGLLHAGLSALSRTEPEFLPLADEAEPTAIFEKDGIPYVSCDMYSAGLEEKHDSKFADLVDCVTGSSGRK